MIWELGSTQDMSFMEYRKTGVTFSPDEFSVLYFVQELKGQNALIVSINYFRKIRQVPKIKTLEYGKVFTIFPDLAELHHVRTMQF